MFDMPNQLAGGRSGEGKTMVSLWLNSIGSMNNTISWVCKKSQSCIRSARFRRGLVTCEHTRAHPMWKTWLQLLWWGRWQAGVQVCCLILWYASSSISSPCGCSYCLLHCSCCGCNYCCCFDSHPMYMFMHMRVRQEKGARERERAHACVCACM